MKYVILGDSFTTGHHDVFFGLYIQLFVELGYAVRFFSPNEKKIWSQLPASCKTHVTPYHCHDYVSITACKVYDINHFLSALWLWAESIIRIWGIVIKQKQFPTLVFFLWLDHYMDPHISGILITILFPFAWSGIYFHPRHIRERRNTSGLPYYRPDNALRSKNCKCVAVLDETIASDMEKYLNHKPVIVIPDISVTDKAETRFPLYKEIRKKAGNRKIVACLGSIEKRKSTLFLSEVSKKLIHDAYYFIFIGRVYEEWFLPDELQKFREFIQNPPKNCFVYPHAVTDTQINSLIQLSSVIFLGYTNFYHSSNILIKAGIFKRPVVVFDTNFCSAARTKAYHLGAVIRDGSVSQCVHAIERLTHPAGDQYSQNQSRQLFTSTYSYSNLRKTIRSMLNYYV